jgi:hypothetical protein
VKTVYSKEEFAKAIKSGETHIMVKGVLAETLLKRRRRKKAALIGGGIIFLAGLAAAPFTGGASAVAGATALTVTAGTVTVCVTAAELAILCGTGLAAYGLYKDRKIKLAFRPEGVEVQVV